MKLNRMSEFFSRIMLAIFMFIIAFSVMFQVINISEHKSYAAAFAAAVLLFTGYIFIKSRIMAAELLSRAGTFKTGLVLSIICFLFNLSWVLFFRVEPEVDYLTFWNTAVDLAENQTIRGVKYVAMFPHILGYSAFLSVFLKLFGELYMVAAVLNVVLTTVSGLIIYLLCLRWADIRTAALAYVLWILCPSKTLYNTMVLSEPYYTCLLLCFLLIVSYLEEKAEGKKSHILTYFLWGIPAAAVLAAMNSARPIAAIPIIAITIWILLLRGEKLVCRTHWQKWLAFFTCSCSLLRSLRQSLEHLC